MDNRGSKSVVRYYSAIVKEQRVDGCRYLQDFVIYLRCTLMSLEISYSKKNCILEISTIHR